MTDRADYIGGGDIAAIMGIDPWRTAFDAYMEHTRDPSWQPAEETIQMRVGTFMEPFLAAEYTRQTGHFVYDEQDEVIHPDYPFLRVHLDGRSTRVSSAEADDGIVEFKTASSDKGWGTVEAPTVPEHYQAQCFFALGLTGAKWCDVSVLLPRGDFRTIRLEADDDLQRGVIAAAVTFWNDHVIPRRPPAIDTSESARRWLAAMPDDEEEALEAGADLEDIVERLVGVKQAGKALASTQELLENQAKALIGEHQKVVGRGWHITYKRNRPFPQTKWKDAAGEMATMLQLAGMADAAKDAIDNHTEIISDRRPLVVKKEEEA